MQIDCRKTYGDDVRTIASAKAHPASVSPTVGAPDALGSTSTISAPSSWAKYRCSVLMRISNRLQSFGSEQRRLPAICSASNMPNKAVR